MNAPIQHVYKQLQASDGLLYAWFASMHTRVDLLLAGLTSEEEGMQIVREINAALQQIEKVGSYYDPESELSGVNREAALHPVAISDSLYAMTTMCLEYNEQTGGCFDVTVKSENYTPDTIHSIVLKPQEQSLFYRKEGVVMDFSGFLKGYALECVRKIIDRRQMKHALINMGNSSVLALGNHPFGEGWRVNFDLYPGVCADTSSEVCLRNECLTTSGNDTAERKHLFSPHKGEWVEGIRRLAVVTDNGAIGEILSTACFVATDRQRTAMIETLPVKRWIELS